MEDNGAQFVYETSAALMEYIPRVFAAAQRASTTARPVKTTYYFHAFCSTRVNDSVRYADSRILDRDMRQNVYLSCRKGNTTWKNWSWVPIPEELPLFYGTLENSYGPVLEAYVRKIFALGFSGVYHDEYGESNTAYTYLNEGSAWDNHSVFMYANGTVRAAVGSIALLTLPLELKLQEIIKEHGGFLTANGAPLTRTIIQRRFGIHFAENGMEMVAQKVQLYTPIMLNRAPGQNSENDPKYFRDPKSTGIYDPVGGASSVCWNILNHLDDGVLSEPYGAALPKSDRPTILAHLWPFTPIELGDGFVIGKEKVLTKASGRFKNGERANATVYIYNECVEVAAVTTSDKQWRAERGTNDTDGHEGMGSVEVQLLPGEVAVQLQPNHAAVIVWEVPSNG